MNLNTENNVQKMIIDYDYRSKAIANDRNEDNKIYPIQIDQIKARKQFKLEISGIEIFFPHKPYQCQIDYMVKGRNLKN